MIESERSTPIQHIDDSHSTPPALTNGVQMPDAHSTHTPVTTDFQPISNPTHTPRTPDAQGATSSRTPTPRTYNGKEYYCASDIAKILGVDRTRVVRWNNELWHGAPWFPADLKTHDGVYLYEIERVEQLKSVYHPKWMRGGYEPSPTVTGVVEEPMPQPKYFSVKDVAEIMHVAPSTVVRWTVKELFPHDKKTTRILKRFTYTADAVAELKQNHADDWDKPEFICDAPPHVDIETFAQLNLLSAWDLSRLDCIVVTKITNKARKIGQKPSMFLCPFCGSNELKAFQDTNGLTTWLCDCMDHYFKLNEDIIAAFLGLDVVRDHDLIYAYAKKFIGELGEPKSAKPVEPAGELILKPQVDDAKKAKQDKQDKQDDEVTEQILTDLEFSMQDFKKLSAKDKRCLTDETAKRLHIGADLEWCHPKMKSDKNLTPRIICKLGDENDTPAYNAIMTNTGREKFKWQMKQKIKWADKCLTAGKKLVFNPAALDDDLVFLTEGEIDAASICQCSKFKILACALGGTSGGRDDLIKRLATKTTKPKIVVLFDDDARRPPKDFPTQESRVESMLKMLAQARVPAVAKFLDDFMPDDDKKHFIKTDADGNILVDDNGKLAIKVDANAILVTLGEKYLSTVVTKIIVDAADELDDLTEKYAKLPSPADEKTYFRRTSTQVGVATGTKSQQSKKDYSPELKDLVDAVNNVTMSKTEIKSLFTAARKRGVVCEKCGNGSGKHGTGADIYESPPGVHCHKCGWDVDGLELFALKNNLPEPKGKDFFTVLRAACDAYNIPYAPKVFEPKRVTKENQHVTGDETIDRWQKINGVINPELLPQLQDAAAKINNLEFVTAANANDISIQKYLGAFRYYSPFSATDEKFFARLRDAKADAKKKIADWKKDKSQPEPTDADKALAALDIININRKVEACLTQAKRAHQKYIDVARRKEVDDKREAEHAAYIREQHTTKAEIADCPVDLILPEGVIFNDEGIKIEDMDKPPDINDKRPIFTACQNLVVPTKIFREPSKHVTQYEIAIQTGKIWRRKVFDGRTLQDARSVSELGNFGAHIAEPRIMAKYFAKIIALNESNGRLEEIRSYAQPGWHDDDFSEFAYPTGGDDYVVLRTGFDFKKEFATRGNAETWKKIFAEAMKRGGAVARIFTGTALAAPLIRPLRTPNMQIHIHGDINNGKTALELLAASIYGEPTQLLRTFESTPKNRQAVAAAYNDLPTFLDEMETRPTKEMEKALPQSVYAYFTGKANQANKRDGSAREPFYFSGARLSTGERPILSDNDQTGAFKRIVQIRCRNLFEAKFAASLYPFTSNNFGHFGRPWTKFIADNHDTIRNQFYSYVPIFTSQKIYEETQVNSVVAAATAYQYFQICIGAQTEFDEDAFTKDIVAILDLLPTKKDLNGSARLLIALRSFVDGHPKNFVTQTKSGAPDEHLEDVEAASYSETYGKIFNNGEVAIYPTALKKIIEKELGFASAETHINKWNEEGKLIATGDRPNQHRIAVCDKKKYTIHFRAGLLSEPNTDEDIQPPFD